MRGFVAIGVLAVVGSVVCPVRGGLLTTVSMITANGGGQSGAGAETNAMIVADGTYWSGGAAGLQGSASLNPYRSGSPPAANITFKFDTAPVVAALDVQYGAGNWAIGAARLSWVATYWANNNRFGGGEGTFDIFWASEDNWNATVGDPRPNPPYATSAAELALWATSVSLVRDEAYYEWHPPAYFASHNPAPIWMTYKTNDPWVPRLSYDLTLTPELLADATPGGLLSFYLMSTSDSLGMCIFTGGYTGGGGTEGQPTLTLDIFSVPEPSAAWTMLLALSPLVWSRYGRH